MSHSVQLFLVALQLLLLFLLLLLLLHELASLLRRFFLRFTLAWSGRFAWTLFISALVTWQLIVTPHVSANLEVAHQHLLLPDLRG